MNFYAHTAEDQQGKRLPEEYWQPLATHLCNVAKLAKEFACPLGMAAEAEIAGLLHDLGKYQDDFQHYLIHGTPRTPHARIGAAVIGARSALLSNVIAGHHAGLYDWADLEPKLSEFRSQRGAELSKWLATMHAEIRTAPPALPNCANANAVLAELRVRFLFSALIDADYLDTEAFHLSVTRKPNLRGGNPSLMEMSVRLEMRLNDLKSKIRTSSLNELRRQINKLCYDAGKGSAPGVFSLAVPTGGSKTLSSARFALSHAVMNGFRRVIYVLPYTSIIEQNGQVFKAIFGNKAVLEHHSLADWVGDESSALNSRNKLAAENWDAPFILTTNVQFFESLFSHKPSACRKLHRLLNSVIIFDECQTFPPDLLAPTLERLKALVALGRTSLLLCTAAQPAFQQRPGFSEGFERVTEIVPEDWKLHEKPEFCRTETHFRRKPASIADLCEELRKLDRGLVVVNTREQAWTMFSTLRTEGVFHLSTLMCPAHRLRVLASIKMRLKTREARCLVISTQLIEAGVDLDFPKVYRALAPLDSIIQATGRCNREGHLPKAGEVIIFRLENGILPSGAYRKGAEITEGILPDLIRGNFSPETISRYFQALYQLSDRDKHGFQRLGVEECYRQIGEKYRWIDSDTEPVLTNYSSVGEKLQSEVLANRYTPVTRGYSRRISRHCINLRRAYVERELRISPKLVRLPNGLILTQDSYDPEFGYNHFGEHPAEALII